MKKFENEQQSFYGVYDNDQEWFIPQYQRRYEWDETNVEEFFESITNHDDDIYYFGNIICVRKEDNRHEVVDGQQRLTTTYLLLIAIYEKLKLVEKDIAASIQNIKLQNDMSLWEEVVTLGNIQSKVIEEIKKFKDIIFIDGKNKEDSSEYTQLKLQPNDHKMLKTIFDKKQDALTKQKGKVYIAFKKFVDLIDDEVKDDNIKIIELAQKILNDSVNGVQFMFTVTIVNDDADAYQLFEAINDTGKDLSISDLVKNQLFKSIKDNNGSEEDIKLCDKLWDEVLDIQKDLKDNKVNINFDKYLEIFYLYTYSEYETKKKVYKKLKNKWREELTHVDAVHQIVEKMKIDNNNVLQWVKKDEVLKQLMIEFKVLNPVVYKIVEKFEEFDFYPMLNNIFMHMKVNNGRGSNVQPKLTTAIELINNNASQEEIITELFSDAMIENTNSNRDAVLQELKETKASLHAVL